MNDHLNPTLLVNGKPLGTVSVVASGHPFGRSATTLEGLAWRREPTIISGAIKLEEARAFCDALHQWAIDAGEIPDLRGLDKRQRRRALRRWGQR